MSLETVDLKELKAIVDWISVTEDVREFSLKFGDVEIYVSRNETSSLPRSADAPPAQPQPAAARTAADPKPAENAAPAGAGETRPASPPVAETLAADEFVVKAPMVGTFYAKPKPDAPDFVSVGDRVTPSSVLCILEVMKLMNNVEAGVEGSIVRILATNEQAVEYGQPLMVIKRGA